MGEPRDIATRGTYFENQPVHPERYIHGSTLPVQVVEDDRQPFIADDRTGMSVGAIQKAFLDHLNYSRGTQLGLASANDLYIALSLTVRDRLMHRWIASRNALHDAKMVCYLSAEFLLGRQLGNNLLNIGAFMQTRQALDELGLNFYDILEQEAEPGLGNGGLGRLAAFFSIRCPRWKYRRSATASATNSAASNRRSRTAGRSSVLTIGCGSATPGSWLAHNWPWK